MGNRSLKVLKHIGNGKDTDMSLLCACGCGQLTSGKYNCHKKRNAIFIRGHQQKGRKHSEETKLKISASRLGEKNVAKRKDVREKIAKSYTIERRKEYSKRISLINKKNWQNAEYRKKKLKSLSLQGKKLWQNPEYSNKTIKAQRKAMAIKPNRPEKTLIKLFKKEKLPYKYVGDGKVWFGQPPKNPDFINVNGQKKIVEHFGNYWHKKEDEQNTKKHFAKYGFKTLVIWESELKNEENVLEKIVRFDNE